jgi:hypothetical protein
MAEFNVKPRRLVISASYQDGKKNKRAKTLTYFGEKLT